MNIRIEPLETRIAPASFFVSSVTNDVVTSAGVSAQDTVAEAQATTFLGVDKTVLLATGDKLVFDFNHNNLADGGHSLRACQRQSLALKARWWTTAKNRNPRTGKRRSAIPRQLRQSTPTNPVARSRQYSQRQSKAPSHSTA